MKRPLKIDEYIFPLSSHMRKTDIQTQFGEHGKLQFLANGNFTLYNFVPFDKPTTEAN